MRRAILFLSGVFAGCFLLYVFFTVTLEPFAASQTVAVVTKGTQQEFPIALTETLCAVRLAAYDGPFLEDGTDEEVVGITALELVNSSSEMIGKGEVILYCTDRILLFDFTNLPAGESILVLERNRSLFGADTVTDVQVMICKDAAPADNTVVAWVEEPGSIRLENTADSTLADVRVFYKTYDAESKMYIGGITYSAIASELKAEEIRTIAPYHVAHGYTRIVKISYDES